MNVNAERSSYGFILVPRLSTVRAPSKRQRPSLTHPTINSLDGFEKQGGHHSQNPTRDHRWDLGPPLHRFRLRIPPIVRSHIQVVDPIVPTAPLPYHRLHFHAYAQMARDVPGPGEQSRPPRQTSTPLDRRVWRRSREVLRIHPMIYERREGDFVEL